MIIQAIAAITGLVGIVFRVELLLLLGGIICIF
jgi:hypothetical protein